MNSLSACYETVSLFYMIYERYDYQLMKLQNTHFQENEEGLKELLSQMPEASFTWLHHPHSKLLVCGHDKL